jgi:hypothetical protein
MLTIDGAGPLTAATSDGKKTIGFCTFVADQSNGSLASQPGDCVQMLSDGDNFVVSGVMAAQTAMRFGVPPVPVI